MCLIDLKLFLFTIYISLLSLLLSVNKCQSEFLFVKVKGEAKTEGFYHKERLRHRRKLPSKKYLSRQGVRDLRRRSQG